MPETEAVVIRGRGRPVTHGARRQVTYLLPPELVAAIEVAAQARQTTKTAIVEEALRHFLQHS